MCYSAQIKADYGRFVRTFGARISLEEFTRLYWEREQGAAHVIPKAVDAMFLEPHTPDEQHIKDLIERFNRSQAARFEAELFKERTALPMRSGRCNPKRRRPRLKANESP